METSEHLELVKERIIKLRYEAIDLEQILILLTSLETKKKELMHL